MHERPQRGCRVNVEGSSTRLSALDRKGAETVVYASTSSIYGNRTEPPCGHGCRGATLRAYEAARERYAEYYGNYHDMAMAGLRFFPIYQGFGGNEKHKSRHANTVAQFADAIANGEAPRAGDGSQTRDFTHVSDVARACCELAADHELTGVYNVGTEPTRSTRW